MSSRTFQIIGALGFIVFLIIVVNNQILGFRVYPVADRTVDSVSTPSNAITTISLPAPNFAARNLLAISYFEGVIDESGYSSGYSRKENSGSLTPQLKSGTGMVIPISAQVRQHLYGSPSANGSAASSEHLWTSILPGMPGSSKTVFASTYELTEVSTNQDGVIFGPRANTRLYTLDTKTGALTLIYQADTRATNYPFDNAPHYALVGRDGSHLIAHKTNVEALGVPCGVFIWYAEQSNFVALDLANIGGGWEPYRTPADRIADDRRLTEDCNSTIRKAE